VNSLTRVAVAAAIALTAAAAAVAVVYRRDLLGLGLVLLVVLFLAVPVVGAAVVRTDRRNALGWTLLTCGVSVPLAVTAYLASHAGLAFGLTGWLDGWPWTPALTLVPVVGLLLLPDGHPPSKRWRPVLWLGWAVIAAQLVNELFAPHLLDYPSRANPTALPGMAGTVADALGATIILVPPLATVGAWSVHRRWRRSRDPALGLVTPGAWLIAASWWGCGIAILATGDSDNALGAELSGLLALAVTAWLAVRRYGLFDTRRVLNQALVYTALSLCVLAVYLAIGAVTSSVGGGPFAVLVAVLAAIPLRDGLQRLANRLVYGDRDDPAAALVRLGQRLEAAAAADDVLPGVARTVRDALRLSSVSIHIGQSTVDSGEPLDDVEEFPLTFAGETIGVLVAARREPEQPFTAAERRLLGGLAGQIAAAGHAVALTRDLRRSRERLITATEEERRRIRRDLHDGLGPGLAGVVLGLRRARRDVQGDPDAVAGQLDALTAQIQLAIADVRRLVYDLRPPALDELGLTGALREQAHMLGNFTVDGPAEPLPAAVEVAAYRIALEAMTNVTRHARAGSAAVQITIDGALHLEITDDGDGLPDAFRAGVGISSMRERAAELGGECTVAAAEPRGTTVRATIPLVPS
jgi:signal transduction histidine kinase